MEEENTVKNCSSLSETACSELKAQARERRKSQFDRHPAYANDIISYWNSLGLRQHRNPASKIYREIVGVLRDLRLGRFSRISNNGDYPEYNGRPFKDFEIRRAILNFSLAATDDNYEPPPGRYKDFLRGLSMREFFYSRYLKGRNKSLFIDYLDAAAVVDGNAGLTNSIKGLYVRDVLGGVAPERWGRLDENKFRRAAERLSLFWERLRREDRLGVWELLGAGSEEEQMAGLLWEAVREDVGDEGLSILTPGWLCSDTTFNRRLPAYLYRQAIISDPEQ